jgi:hypothetical protein
MSLPSIKKSKAKYKTNQKIKSRFRIAVSKSITKKQSIIFLFDRNKQNKELFALV